jgi:hypothetical protein
MLLAFDQWPHDAFTKAASASFFVLVIAINAIWITVKIVLWSHGYRGWFGTKDLSQLKELAAREQDSAARSGYHALRYAWHTCVIMLFVVPLTFLAISFVSSHTH